MTSKNTNHQKRITKKKKLIVSFHNAKYETKEPNFMDKKWYLSTNGFWHKVRNHHILCNTAIGRVKSGSFDSDASINVCRRCIHLLTSRRKS